MNIIILADLIVNSGVGQYIVQLSERLATQGRVVLASPLIDRKDISESVCTILMPRTKSVFSYVAELRRIIKENNIEVVHCNHRLQMFMMRIYQVMYGKIPVVWTCHTVPYPNNFIKRCLGYYGHRVIAISSEAKEWMHSDLAIEENKIDLILNGVDESRFIGKDYDKQEMKSSFFEKHHIPYIKTENNPLVIALHGRIDYVKGLDLLIEALHKLPQSSLSKFVVLVSGNTSVPYYEALVTKLREYCLENKVFFVGWVDSFDIYSVSDLMIQPSRREGFPLAVIEAFLMKVPVIRTRVGGYVDMKSHCIGISTESISEIQENIEKWLSSPNRYEAMAEEAYNFAINNCTIGIMAEKTLETYRKAIKTCFN